MQLSEHTQGAQLDLTRNNGIHVAAVHQDFDTCIDEFLVERQDGAQHIAPVVGALRNTSNTMRMSRGWQDGRRTSRLPHGLHDRRVCSQLGPAQNDPAAAAARATSCQAWHGIVQQRQKRSCTQAPPLVLDGLGAVGPGAGQLPRHVGMQRQLDVPPVQVRLRLRVDAGVVALAWGSWRGCSSSKAKAVAVGAMQEWLQREQGKSGAPLRLSRRPIQLIPTPGNAFVWNRWDLQAAPQLPAHPAWARC